MSRFVLNPIYVSDTAAGPTASTVSMGATFSTVATATPNADNLCYQITFTTSNAVGTFTLEASNDVSNYVNLGTAGTAASANDTIIVTYTGVPFAYTRIKYTRTSGTGTATILLTTRTVGA